MKIKGFCPMGCGETLAVFHAAFSSTIQCSNPKCIRPTAAAEVLAVEETEHVVNFKEGNFQLLHPLRDRLDGGLFKCEVYEAIMAMNASPVELG